MLYHVNSMKVMISCLKYQEIEIIISISLIISDQQQGIIG
ncbi:hypothetical protein pb186bvf_014924 [Paramecium bursaria]